MRHKYATVILDTANNIENDEERVDFLKKNMRDSIKKILACIHNPDIKFNKFPDIKYKTRNKLGVSDSNIDVEMKRIYLFLQDGPLPIERQKQRLTQLLEAMPPEDSELLLKVIIAKKNPYKNIGKVFLKHNFPELLTLDIKRK